MGRTYAELRYLNLHRIANRIQSCIENRQYEDCLSIIGITRNFLIRPYVDPLKPTLSQLRMVAQYGNNIIDEFYPTFSKVEFPYEIGIFLNDKLKLIFPKNVNGAIELSEKYELFDLRKAMKSLDKSIKQEKPDLVIENSHEISEIFEEVWRETDKLRRKEQLLERYGISLGIAAIGTTATLPFGGFQGLLAGLGFTVMDKLSGNEVSKAISEKFIKWTTPTHMIHLYDFQKKYS